MNNNCLNEYTYTQSIIYNFKPELKIWKTIIVKIIILLILISWIIDSILVLNKKIMSLIIYDKYFILILQ